MKKIGVLFLNASLVWMCFGHPVNVHAGLYKCGNTYQTEDFFISDLQNIAKDYPYLEGTEILHRLKQAEKIRRKTDINSHMEYCTLFLNILRLVKAKVVCSDESKIEYEKLYSKMYDRLRLCNGYCSSMPQTPRLKPQKYPYIIDVCAI